MGAGSEWIFPSPNEPIPPLLESTWDVPHMAAAVEAVHHDVSQETMTGDMKEAMKEVMIVTMIAMTRESTDHTDADLPLPTTAEGTALDPALGPIHHVTTEQQERTSVADFR